MKARVAAIVAAVVLGSAAPVSSALADTYRAPVESRETRGTASPFDGLLTGSIGVHDGPFYERCAVSSAKEGNANQQTRPVKQYGQTSGGPLC